VPPGFAGAAYAVRMLHVAAALGTVSALDIVTPVMVVGDLIIRVATLGAALFALVHSAAQRADAFPAAGKLSKPAWLGINAAAFLLSLLPWLGGLASLGELPDIFGIVAITAALVYIVDVRPAVREVSEGGNSPW
jgi:hypothetical protein